MSKHPPVDRSQIFSELISTCDGMLRPEVYHRIYDVGRTGGLIVEVGTALGAATVALALGLRDSGKAGHVYSFDPMSGGPRRSVRDVEARVARVTASLRRYGVADLATITSSTLADGIRVVPAGKPVSVLMLDADGRIDRDLLLLKDRLQSGCQLIIDDVADKVRVQPKRVSYGVDSKMRLSYLLVTLLKEHDVISRGRLIKDTYFGTWNDDVGGVLVDSPILDVYRELVFQSASRSHLRRVRETAVQVLNMLAPDVAARARRIYRRNVGQPA